MIGNEAGKGYHFYSCLTYNAREHNEAGEKKCEWTEYRNLAIHDPVDAALQMRQTAENEKVRSDAKDPLFHYVINWAEEDTPTKEQTLKVADRWLEHMGLEEHQVQIASHVDKDYSHIHLAVNRVHPANHLVWNKWKFKERSETLLKELEREFGWKVVPGKHHPQLGVDLGDKPRAPEAWELHFEERMNGKAAGIGIDPDDVDGRSVFQKCEDIKDELWEVYDTGPRGSFKSFDQVLDSKGLWLDMANNKQGMVITDGQYRVKASDLQRQFSGPSLEDTFGQSLQEYVEGREARLDPLKAFDTAIAWKKDLYASELASVQQLLGQKIPKLQARANELNEMNKAYTNEMSRKIDQVNRHMEEAYHDYMEAGRRIMAFMEEYPPQKQFQAIQNALLDDPGQFGEVADASAVVSVSRRFGGAQYVQEKYDHHFHGMNRKERKAFIKQRHWNVQEKRRSLDRITGLLQDQLKGTMKQSEAGHALLNVVNASFTIHRAVQNIHQYVTNRSELSGRNQQLDKEMIGALKEINHLCNQAYYNPTNVKEYFSDIAWNEYARGEASYDRFVDLLENKVQTGRRKISFKMYDLARSLGKPQSIREKYADFLSTMSEQEQVRYFQRLPLVYNQQPEIVGGLQTVGQLNGWLGKFASETEAGQAIFQMSGMAVKMALSLSKLSGQSKVGAISSLIANDQSMQRLHARYRSRSRGQDLGWGR